MKKLKFVYLTLIFLLKLSGLYSQSAWLPPVFFPPDQYFCDTSGWKLVFADHFNGNSINSKLWYTFNTNNWGDNDDWSDARIEVYGGNKTIVKDENVQVSEGSVKLKIKQETTDWKCKSCSGAPQSRNYTSGYIGSKMKFSKGAKVETRLRMPIFEGSWNTCWLWAMNDVNEIDFAESWSNNGMPSWPYIGKHKPHNNYNLHSWRPRSDTSGNIPMDIDISNRYPGQDWWDWMNNTRFRYEDWHKYTCEWDTASVTIYLDDVAVNKFWKYYREVSVPVYDPYRDEEIYTKVMQPSSCAPESGDWLITKGYPWNSEYSFSKLIFSVAATKNDKIHNTAEPVELGQMEIDYVKVYQRHPEDDGNIQIYEDTVTGVGSVPLINEHPVRESVFTTRNTYRSEDKQNFNLWLTASVPEATYHWKVWFGNFGEEYYYETSGQYIATPLIPKYGTVAYYLRWEVEVSTPSGSKTIAGSKDNASGVIPILSDASSFMAEDSTFFNLEVRFNTASDWNDYWQNVTQVLANTFVEELSDTVRMTQLINKIKTQSLEPYLYFEENEQRADVTLGAFKTINTAYKYPQAHFLPKSILSIFAKTK